MTRDIRLKIERMKLGKTQAELAMVVGVPESYFAKVEQRRANPTRELQEKISAAVGKARWEIF